MAIKIRVSLTASTSWGVLASQQLWSTVLSWIFRYSGIWRCVIGCLVLEGTASNFAYWELLRWSARRHAHSHTCLSHKIFLGTFAKLRKATISFIMYVRPSVHIEQLGFHWTDFRKIWYLSIFRKYVEKIQVSLQSDKNNRYCKRRPVYISDHTSLSCS
jgi:hypothetical protein